MNRQPTLVGQNLLLRPLASSDFDALYSVASDPLLWEQHPAKNRYQRDVFEPFFEDALESGGALAVIEKSSNQIIGSSRFYFDQENLIIGYTFLARSHWGGKTNRELKTLMLDHAFQFVDSVLFHVGENNIRSRRAMEKIGGKLARQFDAKVEYEITKTSRPADYSESTRA